MGEENIESIVRDALRSPKSVRTDAGEVVSRSVQELVEADKYLASKKLSQNNAFGSLGPFSALTRVKIDPGATTD